MHDEFAYLLEGRQQAGPMLRLFAFLAGRQGLQPTLYGSSLFQARDFSFQSFLPVTTLSQTKYFEEKLTFKYPK